VRSRRWEKSPPGEPQEALVVAGARQRGVAHVVLEVEARVVDPALAAEPTGRDRELLAIARHEVQPAADVLEHVLVTRRRAGEARDRADVHVRRIALLVQEGGVDGDSACRDAAGACASEDTSGVMSATPSKAVLITGCSTGIGRATAAHLAGEGLDRLRDGAASRDDRRPGGGRVPDAGLDVTDDASMEAAVATVEAEHGAVGVLINNAGYSQSGRSRACRWPTCAVSSRRTSSGSCG
jgi:predicted protein tyrosine phosphatase